MATKICVSLFLAVLLVASVTDFTSGTILSKAFLQWTKDQYLLNGSSFHGWCPLEGHWASPWNSAETTVMFGEAKSSVKIETSQVLRGRVALAPNASTTATHLRGEVVEGGKKQLYVADLTCAKVGNKDHLYLVVLPVGGLRTNIAYYDMIRLEPGKSMRPVVSAPEDLLTVHMSRKEALPSTL